MRKVSAGGGWPAIWYTLKKGREAGGVLRLYRALRSKNACKTCALGMGGQAGGMVNERGHGFEVCKKSIQAMTADLQGRIQPHFASDFSIDALRRFTPRELEAAGRLTEPLCRGPLDDRYRPISWDDALDRVARKLGATPPDESFFYFSGRSSNEAAFLLQLVARLYGTNHVNNCSYYCHQASGVGLSSVTGSGTATVVLEDVEQCDLVVLIGANPSSNHPRLMASLMKLKRRGGKVIVVNPLREVGLERFRVPSDPRSLLFGTTIADLYVQPNIGGDIALLTAVTKVLVESGRHDHEFLVSATDGWDAYRAHLEALDLDDLVARAGVERATVDALADACAASERSIFCWAMGLTHHAHGVENIQAVANLALVRGMVGRPGSGLLPLRGHSNVQGVGSVGVTPKLKAAILERLESSFGVTLPTMAGLDTLGCMRRAHEGSMGFALCLGGNLYGSNPDARFAAEALNRIEQVVYLSTTLNTGHAWGTGRETIILPVLARDEEPQATTQESMFNYVRLSDGGPTRLEGPRSEVEVIASIAERHFGDDAPIDFTAMREHRTIRAAIAKVVPGYEAIGAIDETKREFQIGGRTFHEPRFATPNGRARLHCVDPPAAPALADDALRLMTVRSEGQFNTVVYEEEDLYRGQERRDVILMNEADIARLGLAVDALVDVSTDTGVVEGVRVRAFDVPAGNAAMYYPEANALVPLTADAKSHTPAFKNVTVTIRAAAGRSAR